MHLRATLLLSVAAALLAACTTTPGGSGSPGSPAPASSAPAPASSPSPSSPASPASSGGSLPVVEGRTFVSVSLAGHDLVPGTTVTLTFKDGRLGASAGCNSMSAGYRIDAGVLVLGMMATTEMACDAPLMDQDAWLAAFLPGAAISLVQDSLTIAKGSVTMHLMDQQATNLPLEGTSWTLDGLITGDAVSSVPTGVTATLVFNGGRVAVHAGCNTGSGAAAIGSGSIDFGPLALTRMACAADAMAVEQAVTAVLQGTQPYHVAGATLRLGGTGGTGGNGLILKGR